MLKKCLIVTLFILILLVVLNLGKYEKFTNNEKKYLDFIDGVIYINLENRTDRKKLIEDEMSKIGVEKPNKISGVHIPQNGHKGCVQSHILALNMAQLNKWNNYLVFEDDAVLKISPNEFRMKVKNLYDYLQKNNIEWDVIVLGAVYCEKQDIPNTEFSRITCASTSTSFIANKHYYKKLKDLFEDCNSKMSRDSWEKKNWEANALDQRWKALQKTDKWFGFRDCPIKQREIWSSINTKK